MSGMSVFIGLVLVAIAAYAITTPLRRPARVRPKSQPRTQDHAAAYQEALLAMRDLDFDHQLGVVAEDDYARLREDLVARAAELMPRGKRRARKAKAGGPQRTAAHGTRHTASGSAAASQCPHCGRPYEDDHRFCGSCGARLSAA